MIHSQSFIRTLTAVVAVLIAAAQPCEAHSPWLTTDEDGRALMFFGEDQGDRAYKLPTAVAAAKVFARTNGEKPAELKLEELEEEGFIGRRSTEPVAKEAVLQSTCEYGLYHGMLLTYYAKHLRGDSPAAWR